MYFTKTLAEEEEKLRIREGEERRREERIVSKETVTRDHMEELTKQVSCGNIFAVNL